MKAEKGAATKAVQSRPSGKARKLTPEEKKRIKELKKELAQIDRKSADTA